MGSMFSTSDASKPKPYYPNTLLTSFLTAPSPITTLTSVLNYITRVYPSARDVSSSWIRGPDHLGGLYVGPTGLAYLFLHLAISLSTNELELTFIPAVAPAYNSTVDKEAEVKFLSSTMAAFAREYLDSYVSELQPDNSDNGEGEGKAEDAEPRAGNCGIINEKLANLAVRAAITARKESPGFLGAPSAPPSVPKNLEYVKEFLSYIPAILDTSGPDGYSNEWCYGRAGTLYLLRLMRSWVPESKELVQPAIESIVDLILQQGQEWAAKEETSTTLKREFSPNMGGLIWGYANPARYSLGVGHGELGIITQILLSDTRPSTVAVILPKLSSILDLQKEDGNFAKVHGDVDKDLKKESLVQFCHGAPGFAISLGSIRPCFNGTDEGQKIQERIDTAVERAREITWEKGILKKEPNMCHGLLGNAFAFPPGEKRNAFLNLGMKAWEEKAGVYVDGTFEPGKYVPGAFEKPQPEEVKMVWENCDYGYGDALGFGFPAGMLSALIAREKKDGCYITYNDI